MFRPWIESAEDLNNFASISDDDVASEILRSKTILSVQSQQNVLNVYNGLMKRIQQKEAALLEATIRLTNVPRVTENYCTRTCGQDKVIPVHLELLVNTRSTLYEVIYKTFGEK